MTEAQKKHKAAYGKIYRAKNKDKIAAYNKARRIRIDAYSTARIQAIMEGRRLKSVQPRPEATDD